MNLKNEKSAKHAFTLAELLIVIAIIGIIAAFVLPIVITNANKAKFVSALQKSNNTFTNAINHAQTEATMDTWNYNTTTAEFVNTYILPHLNVAKDCGTSTDGECFASPDSYTANNNGPAIDSNYYKVALTDGTAVAIKLTPGCSDSQPSECVDFIVDTNSKDKPNVWGKDVFEFQILHNINAVVPYGTFTDQYDATTGKWEFAQAETIDAKCPQSDERYCALKIINDGWEMNY